MYIQINIIPRHKVDNHNILFFISKGNIQQTSSSTGGSRESVTDGCGEGRTKVVSERSFDKWNKTHSHRCNSYNIHGKTHSDGAYNSVSYLIYVLLSLIHSYYLG